jgi:hypothetical protein
MHNAAPLDHPVRAHHLGDGHDRSDLSDGNPGFFEFGRDRSTAASGGASRRRQNHRFDPLCF